MKVEFKLLGVNGVLNTLQRLPPEVVSRRGGPVKLALAKAARVIRDRARSNIKASIAAAGADSSGLLVKSIISTRGKSPVDGNGERYLVRVRSLKYPGRKPGVRGPDTTRKSGQLLEYGSSRQTLRPWLRPAVRSDGERAIRTFEVEVVRQIGRVVVKLRQANGGK